MANRLFFDAEICKQVGPVEAILYCHFEYWIKTNLSNGHNINDGRCWMFTSRAGLERFFDFLTESQIRTGIKNLVDAGILIKGNYNKRAGDRTTWYSFADSHQPEWYKSQLDKFMFKEESEHDEGIKTRENPWINLSNPLDKFHQALQIELLNKENQDKGKATLPPPPLNELVDLYMLKLPMLPKVAKLTQTRIKHIRARWYERMSAGKYSTTDEGLAYWGRFFAKVAITPFLTGENDRGWRADFDYLMSERGFLAIIEHKFQTADHAKCRN